MNKTTVIITLAASLLAGAASATSSSIGTRWVDAEVGFARTSRLDIDTRSIGATVSLPVTSTVDARVLASYADLDRSSGFNAASKGVGAVLRFHRGVEEKVKPFTGIGAGVVWSTLGGPRESTVVGVVEAGAEVSNRFGLTTASMEVAYAERYEALAGTLAVEHLWPVADTFRVGVKLSYTHQEEGVKTFGIGLVGRAYF